MDEHIGKDLIEIPVSDEGRNHRQIVKPFWPKMVGNQKDENIEYDNLDRKATVAGFPKATVQHGGFLHTVNVSIG
jgi:hypothetical protein